MRPLLGCLLLLLAALACTLKTSDSDPTPVSQVGTPVVTIITPTANQSFRRGETITVRAQAIDPDPTRGITRVELRVNNVPVDSQTSENPLGESPLEVLLDWTPAVPNPNLTLTVRAYSGQVRSEDASVSVVVADREGANGGSTPLPTANSGGGSVGSGSNSGSNSSGGSGQPSSNNSTCRARVDVTSLNFRAGPDTAYDRIGQFSLGAEVPIVGSLGDKSWWQVSSNGLRGWISAAYSSTLGDCSRVPVAAAPASPTPAATLTLTPAPTSPANLIISTLSGETNFVLRGGEVVASYIVRVKNVGGTAAGAFNITIFFPTGGSFDYTVPSLAPGDEITVDALTATFTTPGTYRLEVLVDSSGNIDESNKDDNRGYLDIVVQNPTPTAESE